MVVLPKEPVYKELITNNKWSAEKRLQSAIRSMERSTEMQKGLHHMKTYMVDNGIIKPTTKQTLYAVAKEKERNWTELAFRGVLRPASSTTPV